MANDWIKMRTDLYRDPKVCIIADSLMSPDGELASYVNQICQRDMSVTRNVMRNVTVGALVALWGVTRHRGKRDGDDLVLRNATLSVCDDIADLPGLGVAMSRVGWAIETVEGVVFPGFFGEFNSDPTADAKEKAAERQRRYRAKRNVTRDVTVTSQSNAREEKRREEEISLSISSGADGEGEPEPPSPSDVMDAWNRSGATVKVKSLTADRAAKLRTRLKDASWPWREAIAMLPIPNSERFTWQPDFDWLINNSTNAVKIVEGKYRQSAPAGQSNSPVSKPLPLLRPKVAQ